MEEIGLDTEALPGSVPYLLTGRFHQIADIRTTLEALSLLPFTSRDWVVLICLEDGRNIVHSGGGRESLAHMIRRLETILETEVPATQLDIPTSTARYRMTVHISDEELGRQVRCIFLSNGSN